MGNHESCPDLDNISIYDIELNDIHGVKTTLKKYQGNPILIVNTASRCKYTPQLKGLESIYEEFKDRGFTVLGFPSNDFLHQEPLEGDEIENFCSTNYGVHFPLFEKISVKGSTIHPLYNYLIHANEEFGGSITWNFNKFLISRDGKIINRWGSNVAPESDDVKKAIEDALGTKGDENQIDDKKDKDAQKEESLPTNGEPEKHEEAHEEEDSNSKKVDELEEPKE